LVRVTVSSGNRRVDLVLPGAVPVAELVPELARRVGLLDEVSVHGGYRLVTQDGRPLATGSGLTLQGVEDGAIITVAAGVGDHPPRVYDDMVEAMADAVRCELDPWDPAAGRRCALWCAVPVLLVGAAALLAAHGSGVAPVAVAVTLVLVLGAGALSRTQGEVGAAVVIGLTGCLYAAVAGLIIAWGTPFFGTPTATAGAGMLAAGLVATLGLAQGRSVLLTPMLVGAFFLATGLLIREADVAPAVVLTTAVALVVMGGTGVPWFALAATRAGVDPPFSTGDTTHGLHRIDPDRVRSGVRVGHEILVAVSGAVGVLLVLVAPLAVSLGAAGSVASVLACLVVMLRTRVHLAAREVLVGLTSGVLGLLSTALSALWLHPGWRPGTAVVLAVTGVVLLAVTLLPPRRSVRSGLLADLVESAAVLALLPTLVVATGVFSSIKG
jgi:type VII secretion integral membrane protein EccD